MISVLGSPGLTDALARGGRSFIPTLRLWWRRGSQGGEGGVDVVFERGFPGLIQVLVNRLECDPAFVFTECSRRARFEETGSSAGHKRS